MSQIIIICDTAEWFRLVLLLCMHFRVILYILLMGTKICIRKYTFSQIEQILLAFPSGLNCSLCVCFMSFIFCYNCSQFLIFLFKTNQFNHLIILSNTSVTSTTLLWCSHYITFLPKHFTFVIPSISYTSVLHIFSCTISFFIFLI